MSVEFLSAPRRLVRRFARGPMLAGALLLPTAMTLVAGCEEEAPVAPPTTVKPGAPQAARPPSNPRAADAGADAVAEPELPPLPLRDFSEADFSESERNRDPFRSYESLFASQAKTRITIQRQVLVDRYALDELKLVGVVSRSPARALLTDPTGLGWVVKVGDFIGKAEIVHTGGATGADVAINWRVDRIRESDVVLIREDPAHPEIPPTTRVVALRSADEESSRFGLSEP
ncbi:pilus assembly protein PilP [Chondromyces apiculatus]|uniref:Type IV pilus biogenesis protein PilP n=1 Tax=Chondromyces apiculatus DSM 436 TaxID=1192034 RepID=A0A017T915_9BACT|nr:pilus assembly protein PilP [Chondromyces apiculatus]EYF05763.1 Type IV pilus biogenesis protein PilP [Chondromyces apiculatus DSM 436]